MHSFTRYKSSTSTAHLVEKKQSLEIIKLSRAVETMGKFNETKIGRELSENEGKAAVKNGERGRGRWNNPV